LYCSVIKKLQEQKPTATQAKQFNTCSDIMGFSSFFVWLIISIICVSRNLQVDAFVLCPNQPPGNYCDCGGDCTGHPDWCSCGEAQDCCKDATPVVLCPGQPSDSYCDCDGDCSEKPEFCTCSEAQDCCGQSGEAAAAHETAPVKKENLIEAIEEKVKNVFFNTNEILCPNQPPGNYCDCDGDCTGHPDWCSCGEAQDCCKDATPVVLCPGQPSDNYCDCDGDCSEKPEFCTCSEAQECCENAVPSSVFFDDTNILGWETFFVVCILWIVYQKFVKTRVVTKPSIDSNESIEKIID